MKLNNLQKKLLKTALYTSPLIGVMCIAPVFVVHLPSFAMFPFGLLVITFIVLGIWMINIGLIDFSFRSLRAVPKGDSFDEKDITIVRSNWLHYLLSYLFVLLFVFLIKIVLVPYIRPMLNSYADSGIFNSQNRIPARGYYLVFVVGPSINTVILIIQNLILLREKKSMIELENSLLKLRNAEVINQKLKQQIHPHFLFNSLATLKSLVKKHPETAEDYVVKLSDFLRSSLLSASVNTVKLSEELKLCIDYLEIQKIRFGTALQYTVEIPEEGRDSGFVPPFSIQSLLENAIKHNAMSGGFPLEIQIQYEDGWIRVRNNRQRRTGSEPPTGLGLENLNERYRILSGEEIIVRAMDDQFSVSIKILDQKISMMT